MCLTSYGIIVFFFVRAERSLFLRNVENVGNGKIIFRTKKIVYQVYDVFTNIIGGKK